jgi:GNAT superfamily N-acetyltransferase
MTVEFARISQLPPDAQAERRELLRAVFEPLLDAAGVGGLHWDEAEWCSLVRDPRDGRLLATAGVLTRAVSIDGTTTHVAGVCEVAAHPDARGSGLGTLAMQRVQQFIREELAVSAGLLLCPPQRVRWYASLGWQRFDGTLLCLHPGGAAELSGSVPMLLAVGPELPVSGTIDLQGHPW